MTLYASSDNALLKLAQYYEWKGDGTINNPIIIDKPSDTIMFSNTTLYVLITNMTFLGTHITLENTEHICIYNNVFLMPVDRPISLINCKNISIAYNTLLANYNGNIISIHTCKHIYVTSNHIFDISTGVLESIDAIYVIDTIYGFIYNNVIIIPHARHSGIHTTAVTEATKLTYISILNNTVTGKHAHGIILASDNNGILANNIVYKSAMPFLVSYPSYAMVYNNYDLLNRNETELTQPTARDRYIFDNIVCSFKTS